MEELEMCRAWKELLEDAREEGKEEGRKEELAVAARMLRKHKLSLEEIPEAGWHLDASTRDLHHDPVLNEGNIMTEYEEKFSSLGNPICKLIASR